MRTFFLLVTLALFACNPPTKSEQAVADKPDSTSLQSADSDTSAAEKEPKLPEEELRDQEAGDGRVSPGSQQKWAYTFFGFSPDLVYTGFECSGLEDHPWNGIDFCVIKVDKNDFASKPYRDRFESPMEDSLRNALDQNLRTFKLPVTAGFQTFGLGDNSGEIKINNKDYKLQLLSNDELKIFELRLVGPSGKVQVLQKDTRLPASRGQVTAYRLSEAFVQGDKVAVMIEFDLAPSQDYEQYWYYITKYMMVTGKAAM